MDEVKNMKYILFDRAMYYKDVADYMNNIGKHDNELKAQYHQEGVISVIKSLGLIDEYNLFVEKGELK